MARNPNHVRTQEVLFRWRDAFLGGAGPKASTTRYVLLVLSTYMAMDGSGCFPSMDLIAKNAKLSKKAVIDHMARAEAAGWISRRKRRRPGRAWFSYEYLPQFPIPESDVVTDVHHVNGSDVVTLAPDVVNVAPDVVTDVHSNSSRNSSRNSYACRKESPSVRQGIARTPPNVSPGCVSAPAPQRASRFSKADSAALRAIGKRLSTINGAEYQPMMITALVGAIPAEAIP